MISWSKPFPPKIYIRLIAFNQFYSITGFALEMAVKLDSKHEFLIANPAGAMSCSTSFTQIELNQSVAINPFFLFKPERG